MKQELYLIRGLPGSGKSTFARELVVIAAKQRINMMHNEQDDFHIYPTVSNDAGGADSEYVFNRRLVGAAHDACYSKTIRALAEGHSVVVANSFATKKELMRYTNGIVRCGFHGVTVRVVVMTSEYTSIHNVPTSVMDAMHKRWETWPGETAVNRQEQNNG